MGLGFEAGVCWADRSLRTCVVPLRARSGLGYCIATPSPGGIPRRVQMPLTWDVKTTWTVAGVRSMLCSSHEKSDYG